MAVLCLRPNTHQQRQHQVRSNPSNWLHKTEIDENQNRHQSGHGPVEFGSDVQVGLLFMQNCTRLHLPQRLYSSGWCRVAKVSMKPQSH